MTYSSPRVLAACDNCVDLTPQRRSGVFDGTSSAPDALKELIRLIP